MRVNAGPTGDSLDTNRRRPGARRDREDGRAWCATVRRGLLAPALALVLLLASAAAAQAATITVTTTGDPTGAGNCLTTDMSCSLRQAVTAENGTPSGDDTIQLGSGTYSLTQGTDIGITQPVTLAGDGVGATSIDGSQNSGARILKVQGATVTIEDLTMTGGVDDEDENLCGGCSEIRENGGGALFNDGGTVTLTDVAFTDDPGGVAPGAAIGNNGTLNMTDVTFTGDGPQTLFSHGGTISGNEVTFQDDADGCCDYDGGAAYLDGGTVTFTNTTVVGSGGSASIGGGIDNAAATLTLTNDTLSGNTRGSLQTDPGGTTYVQNTIIGAGNSDGGDGDCVASGRPDDINGENSSTAITHDLGDNIDQDGSCDLTRATDFPSQDPDLAPIFDNGGGVQTEALLFGSPALGDPASSGCPAADARGTPRPEGQCDIGAFEAVKHGAPTATTGDAQGVTDSGALLGATVNLDGEAGGFHFVYGTSPGQLTSASPVAAAGVVSSDTAETETLSNLNPGTTYYYDAVADNATASTLAPNVESFKTDAGPPVISNVNVESVTDTTATIDFSIDPQGADTTYDVEYGPDTNYGQQAPAQPQDIGSTPGPQNLSVTLTDLDPASTYHFEVVATNDVQQVDSGDNQFGTDQQVQGTAGSQVTVTDSGWTDGDCPSEGYTTVDWGDHFSDTDADIECDGGGFTLTDTHTYDAPGHYLIQIEYGDLDSVTDEYAEISNNDSGLTVTAPPVISGNAVEGQTLNATKGMWSGDPEAYTYQWLDCDQNGDNCNDTGDSDPSYTLTADDVGDTIRVIVFASNDGGEVGATSDQTDEVQQAGPPSNTAPPVITGTAQQGHTLTTTNGNWDGDPTSFGYEWQDCNQNGQNCSPTGTDANTYTLGTNDVGQTVQVIVTATNDSGSTPQTSNLTAVVQAATTPAPNSPPPTTPSPPTVATTAPTVSVTSAGFSGSVTPNGLATQVHFEYGLDPKYTGGGPVVYGQSTPTQSVGSDFAGHTIGPVAVSGLLPNALYHVRLVATNSDGTTLGPDQTFTTAAAPAPPAPTLGKTFNISPVSGVVLIQINGKFVPLTGLDQIPSGAKIDARHGSLELITSNGEKGKTQHGVFGGAIFTLTQERSGKGKGLVTLALLEGLVKGGPSYSLCARHKAGDASAATASSRTLQLLHASAHGKFRTAGRYSAATVLGTKWTIADRCDGTLVHDITDSVVVNDFVHRKTIVLHAGQSYLAKAKP